MWQWNPCLHWPASNKTVSTSSSGDIILTELFAFWVIFHGFFVVCWFFSKSPFSKNSFRNTIWVSNRSDPDRFVGPGRGPICLLRLWADGKELNVDHNCSRLKISFFIYCGKIRVDNSYELSSLIRFLESAKIWKCHPLQILGRAFNLKKLCLIFTADCIFKYLKILLAKILGVALVHKTPPKVYSRRHFQICYCCKKPSTLENDSHELSSLIYPEKQEKVSQFCLQQSWLGFKTWTFCLLVLSADYLCKQFGPRSEHQAWSGSKQFDTLIVLLRDKNVCKITQ